MAFELRQNLKLTQQLIMTPQLQQAIKLLQMSRLELVDMVNQEMEENPLLEEITSDEDPEAEKKIEPAETAEEDREEPQTVQRTEELTGEGDGREDFDWDNYLEDYGPMGVTYDRKEGTAPSWDNLLVAKPSLTDHLMWQLRLSRFSEDERRIGEQIIGNLDHNGYLVATPDEIAVQEKVTPDFVEEVLKKVQEFDPVGIAARDRARVSADPGEDGGECALPCGTDHPRSSQGSGNQELYPYRPEIEGAPSRMFWPR